MQTENPGGEQTPATGCSIRRCFRSSMSSRAPLTLCCTSQCTAAQILQLQPLAEVLNQMGKTRHPYAFPLFILLGRVLQKIWKEMVRQVVASVALVFTPTGECVRLSHHPSRDSRLVESLMEEKMGNNLALSFIIETNQCNKSVRPGCHGH